MRTVSSDDVTRAVHRIQFAERVSGLPLNYWEQPWFTKRRWRWTAIALLILALIAAQMTASDVVAW